MPDPAFESFAADRLIELLGIQPVAIYSGDRPDLVLQMPNGKIGLEVCEISIQPSSTSAMMQVWFDGTTGIDPHHGQFLKHASFPSHEHKTIRPPPHRTRLPLPPCRI